MLKKFLVPALIIVGSLLVFSVFLRETDAPKGTFDLTGKHLSWLFDRTGLTIEMEENGQRDVPGGLNACYATRIIKIQKSGTANIAQTCTDEEQREYYHDADASWEIQNGKVCIDARPLDRDPECWRVVYRDGTFEFKNEAHTIRWFGRVTSSDTDSLEQIVNRMTQN